MKKLRRKWKNAIGFVLFFCLAITAAMAYYMYCLVPEIYRADYTFFALPAGVSTEENGGELTRMLARDCDQLLATPDFREKVMETAQSDGSARLYVKGNGRSHTIRLTGWGYDADILGALVNAAGDEMMAQAESVFQATALKTLTRAETPAQVWKVFKPAAVAVAFVGSFVLFSLLAMLFGTASRRIRYGRTTADLPLPCLAGMSSLAPSIRKQQKPVDKAGNHAPLYDVIDENNVVNLQSLSARLKALQRRRGCTLTITGMERDTDSAAMAVLLATELAVEGYGVLLVEMDSYQPRIGSLLHLRGQVDVLDCIESQDAYSHAILSTDVDGMFFVDACHEPGFVSRIAGTEEFSAFVRDIAQTFQYVIIHAPSCSRRNDAALLGRLTDLVLMVADDGKHNADEIEAEARSLGKSVRQVAGYVLCDVPKARAKRREYSRHVLQA
ncbi:MAG: CpsD/CapB family tyrosine-protein kinase [Clostridiales bacterium]|nr:CpsD/CapB family tyrosine-protein kinase [Clostridiales bacterium]